MIPRVFGAAPGYAPRSAAYSDSAKAEEILGRVTVLMACAAIAIVALGSAVGAGQSRL